MSSIFINQIFLLLFITLNLFVGGWAAKRAKNIEDYALGTYSLGLGTLTITFIATFLDAKYIFSIYRGYSRGMINFFFATIRTVVPLMVLSRYVFPKLAFFRKACTMGDIMHKVYGPDARFLTGIITAIFSVLVIAAQLLAMSCLAQFFGISEYFSMLLIGVTIILYTFAGGVRAVAATDILQFIFIIIGIVTMVSLGLNKINIPSIPSLFHKIVKDFPEKMQLLRHPFLGAQINSSIFYGFFPTIFLTPPIIQRVLMAKNNRRIQPMLNGFSIFYALFRFMILVLGFIILVYAKLEGSSIPLDSTLVYTFQSLIQNNYLRGFCLIALISIIMSTADSYLNTLVILVKRDIIFFLKSSNHTKLNFTGITKVTALVTGIAAITLSFLFLKLKFSYLAAPSIVVLSSICVPFLAAVIGMKGNKRIFMAGFTTYFATFFIAYLLSKYKIMMSLFSIISLPPEEVILSSIYHSWLWAVTLSTIVFFLTHYRENYGFTFLKKYKITSNDQIKEDISWYHFFHKPIKWADNKVKAYGAQPLLLGFFILFFDMVPCLIRPMHCYPSLTVLEIFKVVCIILCTILLLGQKYLTPLKYYYNLLYYVIILYCLPFFNILLFLQDVNDSLAILIFILHLVLLTILVDWESFLMLSIAGTLLGVVVHISLEGKAALANQFSYETIWNLFFGIGFTTLVGLIFARTNQYFYSIQKTKQGYLEKEHQKTEQILVQASQFQHKIAKGLQGEDLDIIEKISNISSTLIKKGEHDLEIKQAAKEIVALKNYFNELIYRYRDHLHLTVKKVPLSILMDQFEELALTVGIDINNLVVQIKTQEKHIQCDLEKVKKVLLNALKRVEKNNLSSSLVYLTITDVALGYKISGLENYIRKIPALRFVITTEESQYFPDKLYIGDLEAAEHVPLTAPADFPRLENKRIIEAHYGFTEDVLALGINTQLFVLPVKVRLIRPASMDIKKSPARLVVNHPSANLTERSLLNNIREKAKNINLTKVKKAIQVAKNYHANQKRKSGEPFYLHPLEVAQILLDFTQKEEVIIAAILHDVVEDTAIESSKLELMFGMEVAKLVYGVSKLTKGKRKAKVSNEDSMRKLIQEEDVRVLKIKLADRLHNMRTIHGHPSYYKQVKIAEETLQFFIPIAQKIKLQEVEEELKSLIFDVLHHKEHSLTLSILERLDGTH